MDTSQVIAPPPGFELDGQSTATVKPPAGFVEDAYAPPEGFIEDAPVKTITITPDAPPIDARFDNTTPALDIGGVSFGNAHETEAGRIKRMYAEGRIGKDSALRQLVSITSVPEQNLYDYAGRMAYETAKGTATTAAGVVLAGPSAVLGAAGGTAVGGPVGGFVGGAAGGMAGFVGGEKAMDYLWSGAENYLSGKSETFRAGLEEAQKDPYAQFAGETLPTAALAVESGGGYLAANKAAGFAGGVLPKAAGGAAGMLIGQQAITGATEGRLLTPQEVAQAAGTGVMFGGGRIGGDKEKSVEVLKASGVPPLTAEAVVQTAEKPLTEPQPKEVISNEKETQRRQEVLTESSPVPPAERTLGEVAPPVSEPANLLQKPITGSAGAPLPPLEAAAETLGLKTGAPWTDDAGNVTAYNFLDTKTGSNLMLPVDATPEQLAAKVSESRAAFEKGKSNEDKAKTEGVQSVQVPGSGVPLPAETQVVEPKVTWHETEERPYNERTFVHKGEDVGSPDNPIKSGEQMLFRRSGIWNLSNDGKDWMRVTDPKSSSKIQDWYVKEQPIQKGAQEAQSQEAAPLPPEKGAEQTPTAPAAETGGGGGVTDQIERIVKMAERPMPKIVETFELLYDDGKWRGIGGAPMGVKAVEPTQRRSAGFVIQNPEGTTGGVRLKTREEQEQRQRDIIERSSAAFRAELEKMTPEQLASQEEYWTGEKAKQERRNAPLPSQQKPSNPAESTDATKLRELEKVRYKTAAQEKQIELLKQRIKADPAKWKVGDGVGYKVNSGGKSAQTNRGFRIVEIDVENKLAKIRQVADTGLTSSGGDFDRVGEQWLHIADLVRDRKYDRKTSPTPAPEQPVTTPQAGAVKGAKEPWQIAKERLDADDPAGAVDALRKLKLPQLQEQLQKLGYGAVYNAKSAKDLLRRFEKEAPSATKTKREAAKKLLRIKSLTRQIEHDERRLGWHDDAIATGGDKGAGLSPMGDETRQDVVNKIAVAKRELADLQPAPAPAAEPAKPAEAQAGDWTGATEMYSGIPLPKFPDRRMSELDKITTSHSAKLQRSTDDARRAQREIAKVIPDKKRQMAASVYREANGDLAKLQQWEAGAKQDWMRDAAKTAQTLTPEEIAIVDKVNKTFSVLEARGNTYDVLRGHRDNYIPHVWDVGKPGSKVFGNRLKEKFKFNKARTLDTFFDGDQAGFKPKNMAIGDVLPAYLHEMNKVIADRQLVQEIVNGSAKDGRPLAIPSGLAQTVDNPGGDKAVLVTPKVITEKDSADYEMIPNQPALSKWTWKGKDTGGNPIFVKADLALHPEAVKRLNSIIGKSKLREWYSRPHEGASRILPAIVKGLDITQSAMKREMFGLLPPFHQVQEGTHAVGHLVNPFFNIPKIDLRDAGQLDATKHGLMLVSDKTSPNSYLEGVGAESTLISRGIRKLGKPGTVAADIIDGYQRYLFEQYIPGLKYKTYEAIRERNMGRYKDDMASGKITEADVKLLSAEQTNAAYGHLNYELLDRSPTVQHFIRLGTLAPDFLEARMRFFGQALKGVGGSKVGAEQLKAIAVLAAAQAGISYTLAQLTGGEWDKKHPFEFSKNGRKYFMRSVPEDAIRALAFVGGDYNTAREFWMARVNPSIVKPAIELGTGMNYRGEKIGPLEILTDTITNFIPITARSLPGVRQLTDTSRNSPISPLEQLAGSLGLKISRYSPITKTYGIANDWMDKNNIERKKGSYPVSKYQQLRYALEDADMERAKAEYAKLLKESTSSKINAGFKESINHPFTESAAMDRKMRQGLSKEDAEIYDLAQKKRRDILNRFYQIGGSSGGSLGRLQGVSTKLNSPLK